MPDSGVPSPASIQPFTVTVAAVADVPAQQYAPLVAVGFPLDAVGGLWPAATPWSCSATIGTASMFGQRVQVTSKARCRVYFAGTDSVTTPDAGMRDPFSHTGETVVLCMPSSPPTQSAWPVRRTVTAVTPGVPEGLAEVGDADDTDDVVGDGLSVVAPGDALLADVLGEVLGVSVDAEGEGDVLQAARRRVAAAVVTMRRAVVMVLTPVGSPGRTLPPRWYVRRSADAGPATAPQHRRERRTVGDDRGRRGRGRSDGSAQGACVMKASVGDRIVVVSAHVGAQVREGRVVELRHGDGTPPYLVEWTDTGQRGLYYPGPDGRVEHLGGEDPTPPDVPVVSTPHVTTWTVTVQVYEHGDETAARAVLHAGAEHDLVGRGTAHRNPHDGAVPEIGDEVAVARALHQLADGLLSAAYDDMDGVSTSPSLTI